MAEVRSRLVVASRLSPPPLVHTRRSGKPPISGTPCEIHHLRPRPHPARFVASSREGKHLGEVKRMASCLEHAVLCSVECAEAIGADKQGQCLRDGRPRNEE